MASIQEIVAAGQNLCVDRKMKVWQGSQSFWLPGKMYIIWKETTARIYFVFPYHQSFIDSIKSLEGAKWHGHANGGYVPAVIGTNKVWSCTVNEHNIFQLSFLDQESPDPYSRYNDSLIEVSSLRPLKNYQLESKAHILTRRWGIWGQEMGLGKSLAAIDSFEEFLLSGSEIRSQEYWWVAPRSALASVYLELKKWKAKIQPELMTYDGLKTKLKNWSAGRPAPRGVVFDEAHMLKNPTSQRTQAAEHLAIAIRKEWGLDSLILAMTGTPAPKAPTDLWSLSNIVCPGFLKEGNLMKLKKRMCLIEQRENITGGIYPHMVTWWDDEKKCGTCGMLPDDPVHSIDHAWKKSTNEVDLLYRRLNGLMLVKFKKGNLELPDKIYRTIQLKPKMATLNAARLIKAKAPTAIQALTLLRELSDGFQYKEQKVGSKQCSLCDGRKLIRHPGDDEDIECTVCKGSGEEPIWDRQTVEIPSPKIDLLKDLLDEHSEVGRFVVYGGFTGTIDRIVKTCVDYGWTVIKMDGRGATCSLPGKLTDWLERFQTPEKYSDKMVFVGQPESGGMGLTLTASPSIFYYSNVFNGGARSQSEDRIHRNGMDENRGATIIDCIHLPSDQLVLDNLKKKRNLELMTLGELNAALSLEPSNERDFYNA
jgi:hypothetical protein